MKLSTKTRYGTRILIELAINIDKGAVQKRKPIVGCQLLGKR